MTNINIYYNKLDILLIIKFYMNNDDKIKIISESVFKNREKNRTKYNDKWVTKEQGNIDEINDLMDNRLREVIF